MLCIVLAHECSIHVVAVVSSNKSNKLSAPNFPPSGTFPPQTAPFLTLAQLTLSEPDCLVLYCPGLCSSHGSPCMGQPNWRRGVHSSAVPQCFWSFFHGPLPFLQSLWVASLNPQALFCPDCSSSQQMPSLIIC